MSWGLKSQQDVMMGIWCIWLVRAGGGLAGIWAAGVCVCGRVDMHPLFRGEINTNYASSSSTVSTWCGRRLAHQPHAAWGCPENLCFWVVQEQRSHSSPWFRRAHMPLNAALLILRIYFKAITKHAQKLSHMAVHHCSVCKKKKLETIQMTKNGRMVKQIMTHA